jgi:hypothetical protein
VGKCIKIKSGPYKGYRGRVKEVTGVLVRVELDSLMKIVTVKRDDIADTPTVATPFREPRYPLGGETPMHPSRTPLHPYQTPMRDPGGLFDFILIFNCLAIAFEFILSPQFICELLFPIIAMPSYIVQ